MKARLMHAERDLDLERALPANTAALTQDLGLDVLWSTMARGDALVFESCKRALLFGLRDLGAIAYRQEVLADCLEHRAVVRELYSMAVEAVEAERRVWGLYYKNPHLVLSRALQATSLMLSYLRQLRGVSHAHADEFSSEGFSRFFKMVSEELEDAYLGAVEAHIAQLRFKGGTLISAELGEGNTATHLALRKRKPRSWRERLPAAGRSTMSFEVSTRDEAGLRVLEDWQDRAINHAANALAQSAEHIRSFFTILSRELAFYVGCLNLHEELSGIGEPVCVPSGQPTKELALSAEGLYDVGLALRAGRAVVGNAVRADGKSMIMVTGANQGGKSTFLRSLGLAQMMMQAGMFVPALSFRANLSEGIFTHFKREEDPTMKSGKLDEELRRMEAIAKLIGPNCLLLCNESFAATNEQEGSEIAHEVVTALTAAHVKIAFVTHLFELANSLWSEGVSTALFLRTFRLVEGAPLPTSYGEDSYWEVFGRDGANPFDSGEPEESQVAPATH